MTMFTPRYSFLLAVILFVVIFEMPGFAHAAQCPAFPRVVWWKKLSHESVITKVNENFDGDWQPVIKGWLNNLGKLQAIRNKGATASIRYKSTAPGLPVQTRQVKLSGEKLDEYINNVWKRLAILYCLSNL